LSKRIYEEQEFAEAFFSVLQGSHHQNTEVEREVCEIRLRAERKGRAAAARDGGPKDS
jgi:hypothetical protein